jgi:hypothetical protein
MSKPDAHLRNGGAPVMIMMPVAPRKDELSMAEALLVAMSFA